MHNKRVCRFFIVSLIVFASGSGVAQEATETLVVPTPTADGEIVTQIFRVAYGDVHDIASVISVFRGNVKPNPDLGVIAWTGLATELPAVEAAIRSLDVPPVPEPNVELKIYFLLAAKDKAVASSVPAALDGVASQLHDVFGYSSVRLIEVTAMRVRNGSHGKINGILPQRLSDDREARYSFGFERLYVTKDASGRSIRLDGLNTGVQAPHTLVEDGREITRYMETGIQTDIDLREGQKAVIGKTSIEGGAETVFVVVTGTVID
jgi:hypothetical protein